MISYNSNICGTFFFLPRTPSCLQSQPVQHDIYVLISNLLSTSLQPHLELSLGIFSVIVLSSVLVFFESVYNIVYKVDSSSLLFLNFYDFKPSHPFLPTENIPHIVRVWGGPHPKIRCLQNSYICRFG